jgi:homoserine dehydrogenase
MDRGGERRRLRAVLIGAGSLGRAFLRHARDHEAPIDLVGVITAHHGRRLDAEGIDPSLAINLVESEGLGDDAPEQIEAIVDRVRPDVLVECIPQNIRSGEPSLGFLRTALDLGVHVVTANKAAIVLGYRDLQHRAAKAGVQFRFESTVLDGLPIFSTLSHRGAGEVRAVRGVLNATSSLVLESVQLGSTRSRGLARAQALGIAEADSVLDLDGWDAAAKAALLGNVWMGGALRVFDVNRTGCESLKDDHIRELPEEEGHYRLVSEVVFDESGNLRASVAPVILRPGDPFYALRGAAGGLTVEYAGGQTITMLQGTPGLDDAAFGMVEDCRLIAAGAAQA